MDSVLFTAFNAGDADGVLAVMDADLEFYHDTAGLSTYARNEEMTRSLLSRDDRPLRELVPGSMEVYPVPDFGAIQVGEHKFCHEDNGVDDCGTFKFLHIWKKVDGGWKVVRVVSYDH